MKNMVVCITSWLFDSKQPSSAQTTKISKFFYFSAFSFSRSVFLCSPCFQCFLCFRCFYCFLYVFTMFYVFIDVLIFIYKRLWNKLRNKDGVNKPLHPLRKYSSDVRNWGVNAAWHLDEIAGGRCFTPYRRALNRTKQYLIRKTAATLESVNSSWHPLQNYGNATENRGVNNTWHLRPNSANHSGLRPADSCGQLSLQYICLTEYRQEQITLCPSMGSHPCNILI